MALEMDLIKKSYYKNVINGHETGHPVQILGEMYMDEKKKEMPNFSSIRFSQGEVYFLNKDYEAAIFKWENIDNDLKPWALKNIGDAHFEMNLLAIAEEYYMSVKTDSIVLKTEILLQLFSLNLKLGKREKACGYIKDAVTLNPDYSGVTGIALTFFEERKDWASAVELAVNEAIRTNSLSWFNVLEEYVQQGHTAKIKPDYFDEALRTLYNLNQLHFENLTALLWNSYKQTNLYFSWLTEINKLLLKVDFEPSYEWSKLPELYKETYLKLISGSYLIRDFSELIPPHLTNWIKVSLGRDSLTSSSAVVAWNEFFPNSLEASLVNKAENMLKAYSDSQNEIDDGLRLYEAIKQWARKEGIVIDGQFASIDNIELEKHGHEELRTAKIISINKNIIKSLIEKRVDIENALTEKIQCEEELLAKLNGIHHQLRDMEEEKVQTFKNAFRKVKSEFRLALVLKIPELLKSCSDVVKEDSDFGKVHIEINEEMNKRIASYMEEVAIHQFQAAIEDWMKDCENELKHSQSYLEEISESIHHQYNKEKMTLNCDFKVLEDWQRDVKRMTRGIVHLEKTNIMMRSNLTQLFLKTAGKLLGQLSKNKAKLQSKYKYFIESTDYSQVANTIVEPFIQQLELFEKSLAGDMNMFFATPVKVLNKTIMETQKHVNKNKDRLNKMQKNPEVYRGPLTLFELRLRQYELINGVGESISK